MTSNRAGKKLCGLFVVKEQNNQSKYLFLCPKSKVVLPCGFYHYLGFLAGIMFIYAVSGVVMIF
jgi:hypothetical protein